MLKIPTAGGTSTVAGRFTSVTHEPSTVVTGDLTGAVAVISAVGDCVTTPVTRATAVFTVHVT